MCRSCWYNDHGAPVVADIEVLATAELIRRLYEDLGQDTGGPLHWMLDDMNIDDEQFENKRDSYPGDLYAYLWDGRFDRHAQAGEDTSDERKQAIEDTCRLIWASFERMPESHRAASIAWHEGWAWDHMRAVVGIMGGTPPKIGPAELDAYVEGLRAPVAAVKACGDIPCPPFEEVTLHVTATSAQAQAEQRQRAIRHAMADLVIKGDTYLRRDPDGAIGRAPEWQRRAWETRESSGLHRLAQEFANAYGDLRLVVEPQDSAKLRWFELAPGVLDEIRQQYEAGS